MVQPRCAHFGFCGGCSTQHLAYPVQLENKKKLIAQLLHYPEERIEVFSGEEYGYRNRMDFIFHPRGLGLREKGKWSHIIDISSCPISHPALAQLYQETRTFFRAPLDAFDVKRRTGTYRYAVIRTPSLSSSVTFILNEDSSRIQEAKTKIEEFSQTCSAHHILIGFVPKDTDVSISSDFYAVKGTGILKEKLRDKIISFHSQSFFQNNSVLAEKMIEYVAKKIPPSTGTLLDLYGGVGTFSLCSDADASHILIVESDELSASLAEENWKNLGLKNVHVVPADSSSVKKLEVCAPLVAVVDPPRSGMKPEAIKALLSQQPGLIFYISCNPTSLASELLQFKKHYALESCALFDLFPQTNHCEVIVELKKKE